MPSTPPTPAVVPASFTTYALTPQSGAVDLDVKQKAVTIVRTPFRSVATGVFAFINGSGYPVRGNAGTPPDPGFSGTWIIEESHLTKERGAVWTLTIHWLGNSLLPPDTSGIQSENLSPRVERHPLFRPLNTLDFATVRQAAEAPNAIFRNIYTEALAGTSNPALATLLYNKLLGGQDTYYFSSFRFHWEKYYAYGSQPAINPGGYVESPALYAAPDVGSLPVGLSYLREGDDHDFVGDLQSVVKVTRKWLAGPNGWWDSDLF